MDIVIGSDIVIVTYGQYNSNLNSKSSWMDHLRLPYRLL